MVLINAFPIQSFQRIFYPSESEEDSSASRGLTSICGTIWSMCFISRDFRYPSKEHNPVLAIILNRYEDTLQVRGHDIHISIISLALGWVLSLFFCQFFRLVVICSGYFGC